MELKYASEYSIPDIEYAKEDFKKIIEVGAPYGIRPIGMMAYLMNHTEGGFAQVGSNFLSATGLDADFVKYSSQGSGDEDIRNHVFNPFEIGLGHCINWNHDFRGKEALLKLKETETHDTVTLVWNPEDLGKVYASQFVPGQENIDQMDTPAAGAQAMLGHFVSAIDWVYDKDDNCIGRAYGRTYSYYNRSMLSLASLDVKSRELGTEVYVLWGRPGTPQIKIRATVVPFPYNQHISNDGFDVETIPHLN